MKIQYLSDLHLESCAFTFKKHPEADLVVLGGDIATPRVVPAFLKLLEALRGTPVIYYPGNHEYYGTNGVDTTNKELQTLLRTKFRDVHNLEMMDSYTQDGITFVGGTLWTDFKLPFWHAGEYQSNPGVAKMAARKGISDFMQIGGFSPDEAAKRHEATRAKIKEACFYSSSVVVCTHFLPSEKSISPEYKKSVLNPYFASNCEDLMGSPVRAWIHGHTHSTMDYVLNGTHVVANPRGYSTVENPKFNPVALLEIP
jgi:predicted phosphodiesterase